MTQLHETHGFKAPAGSRPIARADIPDATRKRLVKMLAAMMGPQMATPEEVASYARGGWPESVSEMLERPGEVEELEAHVDLLAAILRPGS